MVMEGVAFEGGGLGGYGSGSLERWRPAGPQPGVLTQVCRNRSRPTKLQQLQKTVVLGVTSDPELCHFAALQKSNGPVSEGYADRIHRVLLVHPLEMGRLGCLGFARKSR